MIVEQITSMQRDGVLSGTVSDWHVMSRRQSDSQTDSRDESQVDEPATATTSDGVFLFVTSHMGWMIIFGNVQSTYVNSMFKLKM